MRENSPPTMRFHPQITNMLENNQTIQTLKARKMTNNPVRQLANLDEVGKRVEVFKASIGSASKLAVDARALHEFLGVTRVFRKWVQGCIDVYGFQDGRDFATYEKAVRSGAGRPTIDYWMSLAMAKEVVLQTSDDVRGRKFLVYAERFSGKNGEQLARSAAVVHDATDKTVSVSKPGHAKAAQRPAATASTPATVQSGGDTSVATGLIPVIHGEIGGVNGLVVDARELHRFLDVGRDFSTWIKNRLEKYELSEGKDYTRIDSPTVGSGLVIKNQGRGGDYRSIEYHITLNTGKELAMIENNARGKAVRDYFIECESKLMGKTALARSESIEHTIVLDAEPSQVYEGKISELIKHIRLPGQGETVLFAFQKGPHVCLAVTGDMAKSLYDTKLGMANSKVMLCTQPMRFPQKVRAMMVTALQNDHFDIADGHTVLNTALSEVKATMIQMVRLHHGWVPPTQLMDQSDTKYPKLEEVSKIFWSLPSSQAGATPAESQLPQKQPVQESVSPALDMEAANDAVDAEDGSIVMTPLALKGYKDVMLARQERMALLGCDVFLENLNLTGDKQLAKLVVAAFIKRASEKLGLHLDALEIDSATAEGSQAMVAIVKDWSPKD